ncbi:hypothetical protein TWF694_008428 [Orbilia ellipsospora]|uniref:Uncharacterized protein n=1 Tax=Orbilia ellipsospora TaxID=2528407 RepID=A0AAV9XH05_9PEZI
MRFDNRFELYAIFAATIIPSAAGHSCIIDSVGTAGTRRGYGLGVNLKASRTGTTTPFQKDTTAFAEVDLTQAKGCGKTHMQADRYIKGAPGYDPNSADLVNDVATQVTRMAAEYKIAQVYAGSELRLTLHQVNGDGAGPFRCILDQSGTGNNFEKNLLPVTKQVAGLGGISAALIQNNLLILKLPSNMQCGGTYGAWPNICIVRCQNAASNGPFGGCVPIQQKFLKARDDSNNSTSTAAPEPENTATSVDDVHVDEELGKNGTVSSVPDTPSRNSTEAQIDSTSNTNTTSEAIIQAIAGDEKYTEAELKIMKEDLKKTGKQSEAAVEGFKKLDKTQKKEFNRKGRNSKHILAMKKQRKMASSQGQ